MDNDITVRAATHAERSSRPRHAESVNLTHSSRSPAMPCPHGLRKPSSYSNHVMAHTTRLRQIPHRSSLHTHLDLRHTTRGRDHEGKQLLLHPCPSNTQRDSTNHAPDHDYIRRGADVLLHLRATAIAKHTTRVHSPPPYRHASILEHLAVASLSLDGPSCSRRVLGSRTTKVVGFGSPAGAVE